jgi:P pilus assembly chaperone PapD
LTSRARVLVFVLCTVLAAAVAAGVVAWAALKNDSSEPVRPASSQLRLATANKPYLVYQHVARDLGDLWTVPADGTGAASVYLRDALSPAVVRS